MKEDVNEVLVSPGDVVLVFLIVRHHQVDPAAGPHARQIHQHHARVYT